MIHLELRENRATTFVLLLLYGLRRGEVLGLSWRAIDFDKGVIRVEQQLFRAANRLQFGPVKTAAGRRGLRLPDARQHHRPGPFPGPAA